MHTFANAPNIAFKKKAPSSSIKNDSGYSPENLSSHIYQESAKGVQGVSQPLPYLDRIQEAFGQYDLSHVSAYTGANAKTANEAIGSEAYTTGHKIAFASPNPSLHTVAHEAAHVVQQQSGVQLKGGVGETGDIYEQQADQVADAVVSGGSAENLLSNLKLGSAGVVSPQMVQCKLEFDGAEVKELQVDNFVSTNQLVPTFHNLIPPVGIAVDDIKKYLKELIGDQAANHIFKKSVLSKKTYTAKDRLINYLVERHKKKDEIDPNKNYNGFLAFLFELVLDKETAAIQEVDRGEPWKGKNRLPQAFDFLPGKATTVSDEPSLDFSKAKTKIDGSNKAEGMGGLKVKVKVGSTEQEKDIKTEVTWDPASEMKGLSGTKMEANLLGPDHPLGSEPGGDNKKAWAQARKNMEIITNTGVDENKQVKYVAGHLLNEQVGGPGDDVRNLAPISSEANAAHKNQIETHIKKLVNQDHKWIYYTVKVKFEEIIAGGVNTQSWSTNDEKIIEKAIEATGNQYPSQFETKWGLIEFDNNVNPPFKKTPAQQVDLTFENPFKLRNKKIANQNEKIIVSPSGHSIDSTKGLTSNIRPEDTLLITESKLKYRIFAAADYQKIIDDANAQTGQAKAQGEAFLTLYQVGFDALSSKIAELENELSEIEVELQKKSGDEVLKVKFSALNDSYFTDSSDYTISDLTNVINYLGLEKNQESAIKEVIIQKIETHELKSKVGNKYDNIKSNLTAVTGRIYSVITRKKLFDMLKATNEQNLKLKDDVLKLENEVKDHKRKRVESEEEAEALRKENKRFRMNISLANIEGGLNVLKDYLKQLNKGKTPEEARNKLVKSWVFQAALKTFEESISQGDGILSLDTPAKVNERIQELQKEKQDKEVGQPSQLLGSLMQIDSDIFE